MDGVRLYLRRLTDADVNERYLSWFADRDLLQYYSGSGRQFTRQSILAELLDSKNSGLLYVFGVFLRQNDVCIGNIKLGPILPSQRISDMVAMIGDRDSHGKGMGAEAIRLGNRVAFEWLDLRKLSGGIHADNRASIAAYTNADWVIEGRLTGHYWVNERPMDRILVGCFNPKYFAAGEGAVLGKRSATRP